VGNPFFHHISILRVSLVWLGIQEDIECPRNWVTGVFIYGGNAMIEVNNALVINRPIDVVFAYATSIENLPEWVGPITDAKQTSEGPGQTEGLGARSIQRPD
jgi:hypothetical protein